MKRWEYETFISVIEQKLSGPLCEWPEVAEALCANGIGLPGGTQMEAVREICRLILAERKLASLHAGEYVTQSLQLSLIARDIYANRHDIAQCYSCFCESLMSISWVSDLAYWETVDHIGPVDYIAARVGK